MSPESMKYAVEKLITVETKTYLSPNEEVCLDIRI